MKKAPQMLMSESEVLKKLGAKDFRSLSKKNVIEFISLASLDKIDPKVATAIIDQFPNVLRMAGDLANKQVESFRIAIDSEDKSVAKQYEHSEMVAGIFRSVIENPSTSSEERLEAMKGLNSVLSHDVGIDKRHKNFLLKFGGMCVGGICVIAGTALGVLGVSSKFHTELPDLGEDNDEDDDVI